MSAAPGDRDTRSISREAILSIYLPAAVLALGLGIAVPVIPEYAKSFNIGFGTASLVFIVQAFGMVAATLPTGYLMDRFGRRPVLLSGPLLTAVTAFATAFAGSFPELLVYRFFNGCSQQLWNQARLAMIADSGGDRERGKLITWMMSLQRFGMLFAPALGGFLATIDLRAPFIAHGVLCLAVMLPSIKLVKETAPDRTGRVQRETSGEWAYLFSYMRQPQILYFLSAQWFANLTRGNVQGIFNLYIAYVYDKTPQTLGVINSLNSALVLPIGFMTGYVMDRWGRKKTIVPGFAGLFVLSFFLAWTALVEAPFTVFLVGFFLFNMSQGITGGNMQVLGSDLSPDRGRGKFFGTWRMIGEGGNATSPLVFSLLATIGYAASFSFIGLCGLAVALIIGFKVNETVGNRDARKGVGPAQGSNGRSAAADGNALPEAAKDPEPVP
jgi:MFS family permease